MATTDYLAAPTDLAVWLGVPADDPKLLLALKSASDRFRGQVRHPVSHVVDDRIVVDGNGQEALHLPAAPVTAVASVELDGEALDASGYAWSPNGFLRRLGGCWPDRLGCLAVTYSHGWQDVPTDIAEVVIDQARSMYAVLPGVQTRQVGGQSVTFGVTAATGVTSQWSEAVQRYRLNSGDRP